MRTAHVVLDIQTQSLDSAFTYAVPSDMEGVAVGCAVLVEFGRRRAVGYVVALEGETAGFDTLENEEASPERQAGDPGCISPDVPQGRMCFVDETYGAKKPPEAKAAPLKPLLAVLSEPYFDENGAALIQYIAHEYISPLSACIHLVTPAGRTPKVVKRGNAWELVAPAKRRKAKCAEAAEPELPQDLAAAARAKESFSLTAGQREALDTVEQCMAAANGSVCVIDGVTGSGKTEVYLRAIRHALEYGQGAVVLVPEIALTPQTVARFESRFGHTVAVMHSRMTGAERFDQWEAVRQGLKRVVVGARSALFAPVENLGLVVIDEEHENTYKQESAPRYHARDVAVFMMQRLGGTVVLGSATPSIETLCATVENPRWHRASLPSRANGKPMPPVDVIDMAKEFGNGSRSMFSRTLTDALFETIDAGHKAVLLLNQRGFANFVLCRECGYVPECPTCSVSLTYHEHGNMLTCHHCGRTMPAPPTCPVCKSPYLKKFGAGTQRVEAELHKLLAQRKDVRVIRMDSDTTQTRDAHERLLEDFAQPGAAVLLGTQMIAKGLDFEDVVLVGVINADTQLKLPDYRAAERTFDLVQQVAGRAGRASLPGRVMVQTYQADSCAIQAAATYDRKKFLSDELPKRKLLRYPPYARLANVLIWGAVEQDVREEAFALAEKLKRALFDFGGEGWEQLGAAPCALAKLRSQYRWHIVLKAPPHANIAALLEPLMRTHRVNRRVNVACDIDPQSLF